MKCTISIAAFPAAGDAKKDSSRVIKLFFVTRVLEIFMALWSFTNVRLKVCS